VAGLLTDEEVIDQMYGPSADTPTSEIYRLLGLNPNLKRGTILPLARNEQGGLEVAVPQSLIDLARAFRLPARAMGGGSYGPEDIANFALNTGALGAVGTKPSGALASGAARASKPSALPMDEASRMARAKEMGFDVETPLYHATPYEFSEFVPSNWRGATYLAPSSTGAVRGAAAGGMEHIALAGPTVRNAKQLDGFQILPVYVRGKIFGRDPFPEEWLPAENITHSEWKKIRDDWKNWTPPNAGQFTPSELDALRYYRLGALGRYETHPDFLARLLTATDEETALLSKIDEPLQRESTVARAFSYDGIEGPGNAKYREALKKAGYSGAVVNDEAGMSVAIFDPKNIRSRFAAFDPAKKDSADLLAGVVGLPGGSFLTGLNQDRSKRGISKIAK
jgi:hypothetical protein